MPGIASLPFALLLLACEFAIGTQLCLFAMDLRGTVPPGLLRTGGALAVLATTLGVWIAASVPLLTAIDGYALEPRYLQVARIALVLMLLLSIACAGAIWAARRTVELVTAAAAALAAFAILGLLAAAVSTPTWSYLGTLSSLLAGSLAIGGVTLAMILGHWYLVTPRLPERPLNEMTLALLGVIALQAVLLVANVIGLAPSGHMLSITGIALAQNPAFWLRIGVGFGLGGLLTFMAWQSSRARGMMSATGLLYLATGAVLAGQALACALLFTTAIP
jgi:hypothetical protein